MSDAIESVPPVTRSWFDNPEYREGIVKGMSTRISQDKAREEQTERQIDELYKSQDQTPPQHTGGSSF